ncbi:MAG: hypothetical protein ABJD07_13775 [Gemmatimonadaceae bacterium]
MRAPHRYTLFVVALLAGCVQHAPILSAPAAGSIARADSGAVSTCGRAAARPLLTSERIGPLRFDSTARTIRRECAPDSLSYVPTGEPGERTVWYVFHLGKTTLLGTQLGTVIDDAMPISMWHVRGTADLPRGLATDSPFASLRYAFAGARGYVRGDAIEVEFCGLSRIRFRFPAPPEQLKAHANETWISDADLAAAIPPAATSTQLFVNPYWVAPCQQ